MALGLLVSKYNVPYIHPTFSCYQKPSFQSRGMPQMVLHCNTSRRIGVIAVMASAIFAREAVFSENIVNAFELRLVAPDQTVEQAESGIGDHAQSLLQVKDLLESESWGEAQRALRARSASLKHDIYSLIQIKPTSERPRLRKLYAELFNSVTKLDYAARDEDASSVWHSYEKIVFALDAILSRLK